MSIVVKPLEDLIHDLPPILQIEVRDFIEILLTKQERPVGRLLHQDWAGALQMHNSQYTSVELQHLALDWRGE